LKSITLSKTNQTIGEKIYCQKGNSPDCMLRSLINFK